MKPVSYFNLATGEGRDSYIEKAHSNVALFDKILGGKADFIGSAVTFPETGPNHELLLKIKEITGLSMATIKGVNVADEIMNINGTSQFGCTSVGSGSRIGQTLDLFSLDLAIVREGGALYVTMPPYLCLMGIGQHVAFVTNFLSGSVNFTNLPISHVRRDILRQPNIIEIHKSFFKVGRPNAVNFLLADDSEDLYDIEVSSHGVLSHETVTDLMISVPMAEWRDKGLTGLTKQDGFIAHTNHLVSPNFYEDKSCPRLRRATELLRQGRPLEEVLDDKVINLSVSEIAEGYGFGTIVQVIMDVAAKTLKYKDPSMADWSELKL